MSRVTPAPGLRRLLFCFGFFFSLSGAAESEDPLLESPQPAAGCAAPGPGTGEEPRVELQGSDLWKRFHEIGTEMIITKAGRWGSAMTFVSRQPFSSP